MREDAARIQDMLAAIGHIARYAREGRERFEQDELVQVYFLHYLMVLGEAASRVSPTVYEKYTEVPWGKMVGLRNVLVHGYFVVELGIIWDVVEVDLLPLEVQLAEILAEL